MVIKRNNDSLSSYGDHRTTTGIETDGCSEYLSFIVHLVIYFQNFTHHASSKDGRVLHRPCAQRRRKSWLISGCFEKKYFFTIRLIKFWVKIRLKGMSFHYHYKYAFPSLYQQSYGPSCSTVNLLTLRRLMSYIYIYGAPILDVSRSHTTTQHSR